MSVDSVKKGECIPSKIYIRRVRLDSGGYDRGGRYWGAGLPLFAYESEDGKIEDHVRAMDKEHAKAIIRIRNPNAIFGR